MMKDSQLQEFIDAAYKLPPPDDIAPLADWFEAHRQLFKAQAGRDEDVVQDLFCKFVHQFRDQEAAGIKYDHPQWRSWCCKMAKGAKRPKQRPVQWPTDSDGKDIEISDSWSPRTIESLQWGEQLNLLREAVAALTDIQAQALLLQCGHVPTWIELLGWCPYQQRIALSAGQREAVASLWSVETPLCEVDVRSSSKRYDDRQLARALEPNLVHRDPASLIQRRRGDAKISIQRIMGEQYQHTPVAQSAPTLE